MELEIESKIIELELNWFEIDLKLNWIEIDRIELTWMEVEFELRTIILDFGFMYLVLIINSVNGDMAQLAERLPPEQKAGSSSLSCLIFFIFILA